MKYFLLSLILPCILISQNTFAQSLRGIFFEKDLPEAIASGSISEEVTKGLTDRIMRIKAQTEKSPRTTAATNWLYKNTELRIEKLKSFAPTDPELAKYFTDRQITAGPFDKFAVSIAQGGPEWIFLLRKSREHGIYGIGEAFTP